MSHIIYILIGLVVGCLMGIIFGYTFACNKNLKHQQQKTIGSFVNRMKRLKRNGQQSAIKKSIENFAKKCMDFSSESFKAFHTQEFDEIAYIISIYEGQSFPFQDNQDGMIASITPLNNSINYISKEEKYEKIYTSLCKIIGI